MIKNGFNLNPPAELKPDFKLSPFSTSYIIINRHLPDSDYINTFFNAKFGTGTWFLTQSGKEALCLALNNLHLSSDDIVTILTTTGNRYVSRCVTNEIEKICRWNREYNKLTRAFLVIHEFGIPFQNMEHIMHFGLPVIEDCAYSFYSSHEGEETGHVGDYAIFSFPKIFPVQAGGMLVSKKRSLAFTLPDKEINRYLRNCLSFYLEREDQIKTARLSNYNCLRDLFLEMGFEERFIIKEGIIPGVFMFKTGKVVADLQKMKEFLYRKGIECSVFYGEDAFFIPVHQNLQQDDMLYFSEIVKYYKSIQNDNI